MLGEAGRPHSGTGDGEVRARSRCQVAAGGPHVPRGQTRTCPGPHAVSAGEFHHISLSWGGFLFL